jgi:hypothetical protein
LVLALALLGAAGAAVTLFPTALFWSPSFFVLLACLGATLAEELVLWTAVVGVSAPVGVVLVSLASVGTMFCITVSLS